ncbi:MAG TPA: Ig-like domain-containing protein, partial [Gemmatimonadaceae bacterium]|nr:Ig-like domain-containing protein [Gemmatimonadaceae bacterium]
MSGIFRHFILALFVVGMACSGEHPASPSQSGDEDGQIAGLVISNAVLPATSGDFAAAREEGGSAFVSAAPNTFTADALYALIRNETAGSARVRKTITEGGFDPVKLDGKEGDDVSVALYKAGGDRLSVSHIKIPPRRPPRVVRTSPGKGRVDVALNTLIEIVFSEPINKTTVAPASVRLVTGGADVDGTLAISEDGLVVRFTPAAGNLSPSASYRIVLASALRDLDSEPLDPLEIEFSTASKAISGSILIRIETTSISGARIDEDGYFIQMDALPIVRVGPGDEKLFDELIGLHSIDLSGLSDNCIEAESHRSVMITPGTTTTVLFQVQCTPPPPLQGRLVFLSERDGNSEI